MKRQYLFFGIFIFFMGNFSAKSAFAQLCQGSLGEPVVNITFGSGNNPGPPVDSSLTNYFYLPYDCPADGNYTIGNSSSSCFGNTWHSLTEDHTPNDTSGYMMIVNASFSPGDFYVKKVDGLCDNTTYEFAAWILNILKSSACGNGGIMPNVTFSIETLAGVVLQTYKTGDIPASSSPLWKQYGLFFKTPPGINTVIIRMTNNAPGGCGNDLLLDDITFRPCGALVTVAINNSTTTATLCQGDNTSFTFSSSVTPSDINTRYQWQVSTNLGVTWNDIPGAVGPTYVRTPPPANSLGVFQYRVAVSQGNYVLTPSCSRVMSQPLIINQVALPVPGASNNGPVCEGSVLTFSSNAASAYSWTGPMNFTSSQQSPSINNAPLNAVGKYYLKITSVDGCVNTDSTIVNIIKGPFVDAGVDADICEGNSTQLNGSTDANSYLWQPPVSLSDNQILKPVASPTITTTYILTVDNGTCKKSDSVVVKVNKKPLADAGPDKVIIAGDSTILNATSNISDASILWNPDLNISSTTNLTPSVSPLVNITYALTLSSGCGISTDSVRVKVFAKLFIPNAFTPNNDGLNDVWKIDALEAYPGAILKIFNRYGQMVFTNNGLIKPWDGKYKGIIQSTGTYAYIINLKNGAPVIKGVLYLLK